MSEHPLRVLRTTVELDLPVPVDRAWRSLTEELGSWWSAEHTAVGGRMVLEVRIGGGLLERGPGDAALRWAEVVQLAPPGVLELVGDLSPSYGGPARTWHRFTLSSAGEGTLLTFLDCVWGAVDAELGPQLEAGWRAILGCMARHLGGSLRPAEDNPVA